ncbi:MAG: Trk K+ transport system NAD-binding subunit [Motiliproteus sp.]|jgi:Trk K+ transport system NAD-binding subunit
MKIIILGAGQVGATLAGNLVECLANEANDITIIGTDVGLSAARIKRIEVGI